MGKMLTYFIVLGILSVVFIVKKEENIATAFKILWKICENNHYCNFDKRSSEVFQYFSHLRGASPPLQLEVLNLYKVFHTEQNSGGAKFYTF